MKINLSRHLMFYDERYLQITRKLAALREEENVAGLCEQREIDRLTVEALPEQDWLQDKRLQHFGRKHFHAITRAGVANGALNDFIRLQYPDVAKQLGITKKKRVKL
jgi:hypothetical protein